MSTVEEMLIHILTKSINYWDTYKQEMEKFKDKHVLKEEHYYYINPEPAYTHGYIMIRYQEKPKEKAEMEKMHQLLIDLKFEYTSSQNSSGAKYRVYQNREHHLLCLFPYNHIEESHILVTKKYLSDAGLITEEKFDEIFQNR